jgi:hypothetical protein
MARVTWQCEASECESSTRTPTPHVGINDVVADNQDVSLGIHEISIPIDILK